MVDCHIVYSCLNPVCRDIHHKSRTLIDSFYGIEKVKRVFSWDGVPTQAPTVQEILLHELIFKKTSVGYFC